jgi:nucleotide-binding universal stress UspA family protein
VRGTIVCGITGSEDGRRALELAVDLSDRLDLRLVLAHVVDGPDDGAQTASDGANGAGPLARRLVAELGVGHWVERREAVGEPAALLAQIAAEEAADVIVVGSRVRGRLRRRLESSLAGALRTETDVPVLIAPPRVDGLNRDLGA